MLSAGLAFQSFVHDQPPAVLGAGNRIRVIGCQTEDVRVRPRGLGDLLIALGPLHEDHPAAGSQARRHAVERLGDRRRPRG